MSNRRNKSLHDGSKIYDTPYTDPVPGRVKCYPGFNGGYEEAYPTKSIGSVCRYTGYWERQLFRRLLTVLDVGTPEWWDRDYFLWVLYRSGFVGLIDEPHFGGVIPQHCLLAGRNVYYRPTRITIGNPMIKNRQARIIGENAAVIKLTPDYTGVWDLVHHYAEQLGMMTQSLKMAIVNTRMADVYAAKNSAANQTLRTVLQLIDDGQSTVIVDGGKLETITDSSGKEVSPWWEIHNDVGKNYLIDKYLADTETILNQFCREIGVPVLSDKKERQIESEVSVQVGAALTAIDLWVDTLQESIRQADKVFPGLSKIFWVEKHQYAQPPEEVQKNG